MNICTNSIQRHAASTTASASSEQLRAACLHIFHLSTLLHRRSMGAATAGCGKSGKPAPSTATRPCWSSSSYSTCTITLRQTMQVGVGHKYRINSMERTCASHGHASYSLQNGPTRPQQILTPIMPLPPGPPEGSVFHGHMIPDRVPVSSSPRTLHRTAKLTCTMCCSAAARSPCCMYVLQQGCSGIAVRICRRIGPAPA